MGRSGGWGDAEPRSALDAGAPPPSEGFGRLARDSAVYSAGSVAGKAIGLLLLPIVTRVLGPADFGRLDVLSTLQSAVTSVLLLGLDTGATRLYADLGPDDRRRMFGSWLALTATITLPVGLGLVLFRASISTALFDTTDYSTAVALTGLAITGATFQIVTLTVLRNQRRPGAFAAVGAGSLALNGVLVVGLVSWRPTVTVVLASMAAAMVAGGIAGFVVVGRRVWGQPEAPLTHRLLVLGLPLLPAVAATWVAEFVNRAILLQTAGPIEVGYFSVAVRFASVAVLLAVGFQTAWQPRAFALGAGSEALRQTAADGRRIMAVVAAGVVALATFSPELIIIVSGAAYTDALPAVGLSLVFALGFAAFQVVTMPSAISRRMRNLGLAAAIAACSGIWLNLWWAPAHGSTGTAAAIAVGQFAGVGAGIALAREQAPVPYQWGRMVFVTAVAAAYSCAITLPGGVTAVAGRGLLAVMVMVLFAAEGSLREAGRALTDRRTRSERDPVA